MNFNETVKLQLQRAVRSTIGELVAHEWWYSMLRVNTVARNMLSERQEVRRLSSRMVRADVVTIIPTYRRGDLLRAAVETALAQDVANHAVVVVSDGEPVQASLPDDPRLHVLELSRNTGVAGVVRNVGIRCSRSRYVAFLDDDNEWMPGHLAALVNALESGAHIAYTGSIRVLPGGREFDRLVEPYERRTLRHRSYIDVNTMGVHRHGNIYFSRRRRYRQEMPGEDWVYAWRQSRRGSVMQLPECSVRYLINPNSYFWPGFAEFASNSADKAAIAATTPTAEILDTPRTPEWEP